MERKYLFLFVWNGNETAVAQVVYDQEEAGQEAEAEQAYSSLDSSSYRQHYQVRFLKNCFFVFFPDLSNRNM